MNSELFKIHAKLGKFKKNNKMFKNIFLTPYFSLSAQSSLKKPVFSYLSYLLDPDSE